MCSSFWKLQTMFTLPLQLLGSECSTTCKCVSVYIFLVARVGLSVPWTIIIEDLQGLRSSCIYRISLTNCFLTLKKNSKHHKQFYMKKMLKSNRIFSLTIGNYMLPQCSYPTQLKCIILSNYIYQVHSKYLKNKLKEKWHYLKGNILSNKNKNKKFSFVCI